MLAGNASGLSGLNRGKLSKIQNNLMEIFFGCGASPREGLEFYQELQPLKRKDGYTMATALIRCVAQ
eukprot:6963255-Karenia_brevis.AAC.1